MALRHGFKAAAKRLAVEVRESESDSGLWEPFDPWSLAEQYGVRVCPLSALRLSEEASHYLTNVDPRLFSGALVQVGTGCVIVENDRHDHARRRSTVAHEMSHVLLEHAFSTVLVRHADSCRNSDENQELEAAELSGELLIPRDAAVRMARQGLADAEVAREFAVSVEMARWRMNVTGARRIARSAAARRAR